jgi:protein phosphatase 1 regulatory subunit 37
VTAHGVRVSKLQHISLRRNRISALGAVALAILIRDYHLPSDITPSAGSELPEQPLPALPRFEPGNSVTARQNSYPLRSSSPRPFINETHHNLPDEDEMDDEDNEAPFGQERKSLLPSSNEARAKLIRQIDALPRVGSLLTLDAKSNDIKVDFSFYYSLCTDRGLTLFHLSRAALFTSLKCSNATVPFGC